MSPMPGVPGAAAAATKSAEFSIESSTEDSTPSKEASASPSTKDQHAELKRKMKQYRSPSSHIKGFVTSYHSKVILTKHRAREREIWTEKQRQFWEIGSRKFKQQFQQCLKEQCDNESKIIDGMSWQELCTTDSSSLNEQEQSKQFNARLLE